MSFNLKKYSQMDLGTKKFDPSMLAGATPEEKLALIGEYLDHNIGDAYARGEITDQDIYKMFTEKAIGHPQFPILDQYRKNISQLRFIATELVKRNGGNPNDENSVREAVGIVIQKVLNRIQTKFVPQLVDIHSSSTRTEDKMKTLLDVEREDLIPSVRRLLSQEIIDEKRDVIVKFKQTVEKLTPKFSLDEILIVVNEGKVGLSKLTSKFSENDLAVLEREVKRLNDDVNNKPNRYWNRVLSQHGSLPAEELAKWQSFQYTPVDWSLKAILREAGYEVVAPGNTVIRSSYSDAYEYFYPAYQDNGQPFGSDYDKKQYALRRLAQLIENDYNNIDEMINVIGKETLSDSTGKMIQGYFRHSRICNRDKAQFFIDLDSINLSELRHQLQETVYVHKPDSRYGTFNLLLKSDAERDVLSVFREKYNLDPIPFDTALPSPEDCPTNENTFKIDFLLPSDVLDGFTFAGDQLKPIIRKKVLFVGEYFGEDRDNPHALGDKKWVQMDGSPAYYRDKQEGNIEKIMEPGLSVPERAVYGLRSHWKVATIEALGHMIGTGGLALKRKDIQTPKNLMPKLDQKNILYTYEGASDNPKNGAAVMSIINHCIGDPAVLHYANYESIMAEMNSPKTMCLNVVECAIVNIKMSQGLALAKQAFLTQQNGFHRENLFNHNLYMADLFRQRDEVHLALSSIAVGRDTNKVIELAHRLNAINKQIDTLEKSPLRDLKEKLDELVNSEAIQNKIQKLLSLKNRIESGQYTPTLEQMRVHIRDIDEGQLNQALAFNLNKMKKY